MPEISGTDGGDVQLLLDADELRLLRGLLKEMSLLLEADIPREDAVIGRLFPDAYDSEADAATYRELVGDALRAEKLRALHEVKRVADGYDPSGIRLTGEQIEALLAVLTDMRLAIGTRLEVTEEDMATEIDPEDPDAAAYSVLHWLGWFQELLLAAMVQEVEP